VSAFSELAKLTPRRIWHGVSGRVVESERLTFSVVEIDAGTVIPAHSHENEQVGLLLTGALTFRIGHEHRELAPGALWSIPADVPHEVKVGEQPAVLVEVFAPPRVDWQALERDPRRQPRWPHEERGAG
jgi:quercetin dioxygenase-like cupin family protein